MTSPILLELGLELVGVDDVPVVARASRPAWPSTTRGWALLIWLVPVVEYRVCPIANSPAKG